MSLKDFKVAVGTKEKIDKEIGEMREKLDDKTALCVLDVGSQKIILEHGEEKVETEMGGQLAGIVGMLGLVIGMSSMLNPGIRKTTYPWTYKSYELLSLNFSDYTSEDIYVKAEEEEKYRRITEKYRNTRNVLVRKEITTYENSKDPGKKSYEFFVIDLEKFNAIPKYADGEVYYQFENMRDKEAKYSKSFGFISYHTKDYFNHMSKDHRKWEHRLNNKPIDPYEEHDRDIALSINIDKQIMDSLTPVSPEEIFCMDEPDYYEKQEKEEKEEEEKEMTKEEEEEDEYRDKLSTILYFGDELEKKIKPISEGENVTTESFYYVFPLDLFNYTSEEVYFSMGDISRCLSKRYLNRPYMLIHEVRIASFPHEKKKFGDVVKMEKFYYLCDQELFDSLPKYSEKPLFFNYKNVSKEKIDNSLMIKHMRAFTRSFGESLSEEHEDFEGPTTFSISKDLLLHLQPIELEEIFDMKNPDWSFIDSDPGPDEENSEESSDEWESEEESEKEEGDEEGESEEDSSEDEKSEKLYKKTYEVLPLDFSKYTSERVYIQTRKGTYPLREKYANTPKVCILESHMNKSYHRFKYVYYLIDRDTFNKIPKRAQGQVFYSFENVKLTTRKYATKLEFKYYDIMTLSNIDWLSKEYEKWNKQNEQRYKSFIKPLPRRLQYSNGSRLLQGAREISIHKDIFNSMKPIEFEELFDTSESYYDARRKKEEK